MYLGVLGLCLLQVQQPFTRSSSIWALDRPRGHNPSHNFLFADSKHQKLELTSPRSVEACLQLGIDPPDLRYRPLEYFLKQEHGIEDLAELAYQFHEGVRQV
jgi:hypothetical protein